MRIPKGWIPSIILTAILAWAKYTGYLICDWIWIFSPIIFMAVVVILMLAFLGQRLYIAIRTIVNDDELLDGLKLLLDEIDISDKAKKNWEKIFINLRR